MFSRRVRRTIHTEVPNFDTISTSSTYSIQQPPLKVIRRFRKLEN